MKEYILWDLRLWCWVENWWRSGKICWILHRPSELKVEIKAFSKNL